MTKIEDEDNDKDYECCLFLRGFDKRNCVRIKLLLIILCDKATHHILKEKKT